MPSTTTPFSPQTKEKGNPPLSINSPITRIGRDSTRKLYLSPDYTINLCGGLNEGLNGGKLCHNPSCMATKHPTSITVSLPPFHAYLNLPGSFILHPLPLLCYKDISLENIKKLKLTTITPQEAVTFRRLINTYPLDTQEEDILSLLALYN